MSNELRRDVLLSVRQMFEEESREGLVCLMDFFGQQMAELAALRRYRIIADVMLEIGEVFRYGRTATLRSDMIEMLAAEIDLHPDLIMSLMHEHELSPAARISLAKNMVAQDDYDTCTIGEWFEERWLDANEDAVILILEGIVTQDRNKSIMSWGVTSLLVKACMETKLSKLRQWFIVNEDLVFQRDMDECVGSGLFVNEAFEVYDAGLHKLAKRMLPDCLERAEGTDLVRYSSIMGRALALDELKHANAETALCYILASEFDFKDLLPKIEGKGLSYLTKHINDYSAVAHPIIHDRLQFLALRMIREVPGEFVEHWKPFKKMLDVHGLSLSRSRLKSIYTEIGEILESNVPGFCATYGFAKTDRIVLDTAQFKRNWAGPLKKVCTGMSYPDALPVISARTKGLELPDWFFRKIISERYPRWSRAEQLQMREKAPEWLMALSDVLKEDKLMTDLGL